MQKFDGVCTFAELDAIGKISLGGTMLEYFMAKRTLAVGTDPAERRAALYAEQHLYGFLNDMLSGALPGHFSEVAPTAVPNLIGPTCRVCGCSEHNACSPPCSWTEPDLCSACG